MSGNGLSIGSLLSKYLGSEDCRDLEEVLVSPLSNKKKLKILQKIIHLSERNITSSNYLKYAGWLNQIIEKISHLGSRPPENNAFFSHHDNIREFVINELHSAKKEIKICMFTISDNPIAETVAGCHKMGIKVRIITDDGKIFDKGSDIYSLDRMGIRIKIDTFRSLMHHKFVLIDNKKLLTGSYNWTRSGADINNENVLITTDHTIIKAYKKEFKRLWKIMKPLPH
jgi:phosphatidylserine/phosphatidylglycerophosphate/cardiolipin synthase-like enzyme